MRKSLPLIFAILCVVLGTPSSPATSYTPIFVLGGANGLWPAIIPTAAPDVTFPFADLQFTWESTNFGFYNVVGVGGVFFNPNDVYQWFGSTNGSNFADFSITDLTTGSVDAYRTMDCFACIGTNVHSDFGPLTFAPVTTPEPSSVALMLAGLGVLLVTRKRWAEGLQQAS